jgi:hypothetical protein
MSPNTGSTSGSARNAPTYTMEQMSQLVQQLQAQNAELMARSNQVSGAVTKVPPPRPFSGKPEELRGFLTQMRVFMRLYAGQFGTEEAKVLYAGSLLEADALAWMEPHLRDRVENPKLKDQKEETREIFESYENFETTLQEAFGSPDSEREAERKLVNLRQTGSASKYAAQFRQISSHANWDDIALKARFYEGLREDVKDDLCKEDRSGSLADYIEKAVVIDNRLYERRTERKGHGHGRNQYRANIGRRYAPKPRLSTAYGHHSGPMELDATQHHRKPRQDPRSGKCFNCGKEGHIAKQCPAKKQWKPVPEKRANATERGSYEKGIAVLRKIEPKEPEEAKTEGPMTKQYRLEKKTEGEWEEQGNSTNAPQNKKPQLDSFAILYHEQYRLSNAKRTTGDNARLLYLEYRTGLLCGGRRYGHINIDKQRWLRQVQLTEFKERSYGDKKEIEELQRLTGLKTIIDEKEVNMMRKDPHWEEQTMQQRRMEQGAQRAALQLQQLTQDKEYAWESWNYAQPLELLESQEATALSSDDEPEPSRKHEREDFRSGTYENQSTAMKLHEEMYGKQGEKVLLCGLTSEDARLERTNWASDGPKFGDHEALAPDHEDHEEMIFWGTCVYDDCRSHLPKKLKQDFFPRRTRPEGGIDEPFHPMDLPGWDVREWYSQQECAVFTPTRKHPEDCVLGDTTWAECREDMCIEHYTDKARWCREQFELREKRESGAREMLKKQREKKKLVTLPDSKNE